MHNNNHKRIDSHCHLSMIVDKGLSLASFMKEAEGEGVHSFIDIGVDKDDFPSRYSLLEHYENVFFSVGLYPSWAEKEFHSALKEIEVYLKNERVVALGEFGLDYHWDFGDPEDQKTLFRRQIELANRNSLPIIIHTRDADTDTLDVLRSNRVNNRGVIHCSSSSKEFTKQYLDLGFYISYAGNITFKKADDLRDALKIVPLDRLLLETDSPYLAPQAVRGKINHPAYIAHTYQFVSEFLGIDESALEDRIYNNFQNLFFNLQE